jgi:uncharacterized membrane protein YdbT with pleckstrin-like domain
MPYPKKLLNDDETIALDLHPHWWSFAEPAGALIVALLLSILVKFVWNPGGGTEKALSLLLLAVIVVAAIWLLIRYLKWATTNFVITSDRIVVREGVLAKSGIEIPLERVNNVNFRQSIFERMIGAGDLLIESGGEEGAQHFSDVRKPEQVQKLIYSTMEKNVQRLYSGNNAGTDVATQLEKLEAMMQRGTITREEFETQKRKLL